MFDIDIVIPTYNRAEYLRLAIESVVGQSAGNYNLYVLDNGSSDNTKEIVEAFESSKIHYVLNESNLGMVGNWNRALITGDSDLLHIFHDDDILERNFVETVSQFYAENTEIVFLHTAGIIVDFCGNQIDRRVLNYPKVMDGDTFFTDYLIKGVSIICPSVVIRRSCLPLAVHFDEELPFTADINFWLILSRYGRVGYIDQSIIRYRFHEASGTGALFDRLNEKLNDRAKARLFLEREVVRRRMTEQCLRQAPANYFYGALIADIWFCRLLGGSFVDTIRVAAKVFSAHHYVILNYRFWMTLVKVSIPLSVINAWAERRRKSRINYLS